MENKYTEIIQILKDQKDLLIVGHEDPDCDCLGSMLGLYHAFDGDSKNWSMLRVDAVPWELNYLPHLDKMRAPQESDKDAAAVLLIDCGDVRRTGTWLESLLPGKKFYCIDHHASNAFSGDYSVVEPDAAAACEIVAAIAKEAGIQPDDDTALCLFSGMVGDTGCFRFQNTKRRTMELAAWLLPQVDLETVRINLYESRTYASMKMVGRCYENFEVECDGRLCYTFVTKEERDRYNATPSDCHDIVNNTLALSGVKIGIMFEEHDGYVKMSFRSRKGYEVDKIATHFGGGGHKQASGCKMDGTLRQVMDQVLPEARKFFQ